MYPSENLVQLPKEHVMDVSIKSSDKQTREALTKVRDNRRAAKDRRSQHRKNRRDARTHLVIERRLRRRIEKTIRLDLLAEKRRYLRGEATGSEYMINTKIIYKSGKWSFTRPFVERILNEELGKHAGFKYEANFDISYEKQEWCNFISIRYTLLEQ